MAMRINLWVTAFMLLAVAQVRAPPVGCSLNGTSDNSNCFSRPGIIQLLFDKTKEAQVQTEEDFVLPPLFWKKKKGIYGSDVKLNFHGEPAVALMRETFKVFDNNMFATAWITVSLIEAYKYGGAPMPTDEQIRLSIEAIGHFHDRNRPQPNSIMTFWPEVFNDTSSCWQSTPGNLLSLFKMADYVPWTLFEDILKLMGLKTDAKYIDGLIKERSHFARAFHIPPDFDDTFVNLGLGALLTEYKDDFPESYQLWLSQNTALDTIWQALKAYAYRPFSNDSKINTVDTRTYFYIRGFLEEAKSAGKDVALIPTWVQDLEEDVKMVKRGVGMPFNVNNVDVTVSANAIFGITAAVASGLVNESVLNDPDVEKIYSSTSDMLVWEIERDFEGRRDLALTYYPSAFEFYWFISRTFVLLERHAHTNKTLLAPLETVRQKFGNVLRNHVTNVVISQALPEGTAMLYFDDFLGDGDVTGDGKTEVKGEDRIFTTTMAVNTLVNTWSVFDPIKKHIRWAQDAPANVLATVSKATAWLMENVLSGNYKPWNAFFSGSGKGFDSLPFWYPFNRLEFLNGTKIPLNVTSIPSDIIFGFQGVTTHEQYEAMLNQTHFGMKTPLKFIGYNAGTSYFPFWSSETYTYTTTMLALAQAQSLSNSTYNSISTDKLM
ncbi:uncharacterized protein LOC135475740 [Liolophura sinensis]|uniref:uncharacterized protein LOC135475740 n=1 Tax=Liolophura sinensis TaxID=3198878 RepID=UPI00315936CB